MTTNSASNAANAANAASDAVLDIVKAQHEMLSQMLDKVAKANESGAQGRHGQPRAVPGRP